mgnify:CR=1 FL=1
MFYSLIKIKVSEVLTFLWLLLDKDGATALVYAAMGNHLEVVQLLYGQGADLDVQDKKNGWTALMQATLYG